MKIAASIVSAFVAGSISANAFVSPQKAPSTSTSSLAFTRGSSSSVQSSVTPSVLKSMSDELDIPCEDECALESYPNLPESVHPGVNTGQAMLDLLQHAKDNGECFFSYRRCHSVLLLLLLLLLVVLLQLLQKRNFRYDLFHLFSFLLITVL